MLGYTKCFEALFVSQHLNSESLFDRPLRDFADRQMLAANERWGALEERVEGRSDLFVRWKESVEFSF